jgi:4-methyl-5(b-hydroxyethyl)-thiazole monophosphate biosynthesis
MKGADLMIYVFFAPGFEEIEALATVDVLRRAGLETRTVGVTSDEITGAHGITVRTDAVIAQVAADNPAAVVLPGGMPGTLNLEKCPEVCSMTRRAYENGRIVAAICAAPSVLGHLGILQGRRATCYPGFETELTGAEKVPQGVCRDGQVITANGAGNAIPFGLEIVRAFCGDAAADGIASAMQCGT